MARLDALRVKSERLEDGAWIGYYGGDLTHVDVVDPDAIIIFGANIDESMEDEIRVTVIATGIEEGKPSAGNAPKPASFVKPQTSTSRITKAAEEAAGSKVSSFTSPTSEIPPWIRNK